MHENELPTSPGYYFFEGHRGQTTIVQVRRLIDGELVVHQFDSGCSLPVSVRKFCGDQCQWGRWGRKIDMPNERHDPAANEGPDEDANAETVPLKDYQHLQEQHERIEDAAGHLLGQCESFVRLFAASSFYYKDRDRELMTKFRAFEAFSACEKARNAGIGLD